MKSLIWIAVLGISWGILAVFFIGLGNFIAESLL
jgi:hypothetical protein